VKTGTEKLKLVCERFSGTEEPVYHISVQRVKGHG